MAIDGPTPAPCNKDIFNKGDRIALASGSSSAIEDWVQLIAKNAQSQVDWHYAGGIARILHLGDADSCRRTIKAINDLRNDLSGNLMGVFDPNDEDQSRAVAYEADDGELVLDDPDAAAMMNAVNQVNGKNNCRATLEMNRDRLEHFKRRITELNKSPDDVLIILVNVDDVHGGPLAEALMPGTNWASMRAEGQVTFARGLADRPGLIEIVRKFDQEAVDKMESMPGEVTVLVVDYGVAEVFAA